MEQEQDQDRNEMDELKANVLAAAETELLALAITPHESLDDLREKVRAVMMTIFESGKRHTVGLLALQMLRARRAEAEAEPDDPGTNPIRSSP